MVAAEKWLSMATNPDNLFFHFGVNSEAHQQEFSTSKVFALVHVYENCRPGVAHTVTLMTRSVIKDYDSGQDIIVLASDDFEAPLGWDEHIANQYSFEWSGALICNDAYAKSTNIVPLPILSGACLKRLNGVVYSPHYSHFFSDQEFFDIVTELKLVKNLRGTGAPKFEHKHWTFGGRQRDKFDERNTTWWDKDKATYERRKSLPVEEKLKLPDWWSE